MSNIRQSILIRIDLNLPKGLSEAQVAHLHFAGLRNTILDKLSNCSATLSFTQDEIDWLRTPYVFVHGVPNVEVLRHFANQANNIKVQYTEWRDTIYVKVSDTQKIVVENCLVGFSMLGESDKIKAVIGDLPLL